jgi:GNAT superfamily N-acetyltransferase
MAWTPLRSATRTVIVTAATTADAAGIAWVRNAAANALTEKYGRGHWSPLTSEKAVARAIETSRTLVATSEGVIVGTLALVTKKPWAIDTSYFTAAKRPLYLLSMAVAPVHQGQGVGRRMLDEAVVVARAWPSDAIRLDAYDAVAGAGGFYAACGFREVGRVAYRQVPLVYFERIVMDAAIMWSRNADA